MAVGSAPHIDEAFSFVRYRLTAPDASVKIAVE
jgi:hypothetical protein